MLIFITLVLVKNDFMKKLYALILFLSFSQISKTQILDTLPVIVHIIYNGEAYGTGTNLDSVQVYSQFDVLNEDYRMLNADLANTPSVFAPLIADMGLNFAPATIDPNGNPLVEPGIDRVNRNTLGFTTPPYSMTYINSTIKPQTVWDPYKYLNIWVMNVSGGLLGYSTFPNNSGLGCLTNTPADSLRDGVVVHYCALGRTGNLCPPYHKGRTATYEIAQWLGLKRLAQVSCGDDCVTDTPLGDYSYGGCPAFPYVSTSCNNGPNGDLICNFLTYVDDSCKVMFTLGQKGRIDTTLTNGTYQSALRLSNTADPLSVNQLSYKAEMSFFPNPSNGIFTIRLMNGKWQTAEVVVLSLLGAALDNWQINPGKTEIDLSMLPTGIYFVKVNTGTRILTGKVIKQ